MLFTQTCYALAVYHTKFVHLYITDLRTTLCLYVQINLICFGCNSWLLQVLAIEFVTFAIEFVPLANEFVTLAIESVALARKFVMTE